MFSIGDISKNAEFTELPNGYSYRILDLTLDGVFCTVDLELRKDETKANDLEEHEDVMDNIINDILNFEYFMKAKVEKYNPDYSLKENAKNIYRLNFTTE